MAVSPIATASVEKATDKAKAEEAPKTKLTSLGDLGASIRLPTPDQNRAIFRKLEETYDEVNKRYLLGNTDQSLADALKFPRAWVTEYRKSNFGPEGVDPAIVALRDDMTKLRVEVEAHVGAALDAASKLESVTMKITALQGRLEKLEPKR